MTTESNEAIKLALLSAEQAPDGIVLDILMDRNIDHSNVIEYAAIPIYGMLPAEFRKLVDAGWITFRTQFEYSISGRKMMAYLAKMKSN